MFYKNKQIEALQSVDTEKNTAQMQLFGVIGTQVDGNRFASDMLEVAGFGFDEVKININSVGGSIVDGFSIMNAMNVLRTGGTSVATFGLGVMDSMAGIILAFGDRGKREATSFSSGVIHEPLIQQDDGKEITIDQLPDGELKNELTFMRNSLITSLVGSTGRTRSEIAAIMKEGTRRAANELKSIGMIDRVVQVSNQIDTQNLSRVEAMAACSEIVVSPKILNNSKIVSMKLVNQKLGLNAEASEASAVDAVERLIDRTTAAEAEAAKIAAKDTEIQKLKDEKKSLEDKLEASNKAAIETYVDAQIEAGKFNKEKRDDLINQASDNFDGFKAICESLNGQFVDVTKKLGDQSDGGSGDGNLLDQAKKFHEHDVAGTLSKFKNEVGEKKFEKIENYYIDNMDKIVDGE